MRTWTNKSPGDLSIELPAVSAGNVEIAIDRACRAFDPWRKTPLEQRGAALKRAQALIARDQRELAQGIATEIGKPLKESLGEVAAAIAKIDLAIADANRYLADDTAADNVHPNLVRRRARGVAVVIGPFNFPIHLAHGAITAYLLAGNTVIFKPSPLGANVCAHYGRLMREAMGDNIFQIVQGGAEQGQQLVSHPAVRSVCFTGSVAAGRAIARATVDDLGKDVALELGGKNAAIVCADADLDAAAAAVAEAMCLTAGQRCNSTSRVIVDRSIESDFLDRLRAKLRDYVPGDPLLESTRLGPVVSQSAKDRYLAVIGSPGDWLVPGSSPQTVAGKHGHYVLPAVLRVSGDVLQSSVFAEEIFAPVLAVTACASDQQMIDLTNGTPYGLTASVFTADRERFLRLADELEVGNVYQNLPTTFSPSTLPFGSLKSSGNRHPGGRGFVRFASDEQVLQMKP
ncbi:MAG: aldehyde dehydrogenase family protein [Burkholderiales bacterium]|nr:aldehyde dehydrogenase family protein [Phycisphaerae bacterium]